MKKDTKYKCSPLKGKRKLEYSTKGRPSVKLPLIGKTIYLDVKEVKHLKRLQLDLKRLGGTIEEFLSKDIKYLITTQPRPKRRKDADCDGDNPIPSPFNCDPSPSPGNPEDRKVPTVTRGKALAEKARVQARRSNNLLDNAERWGVKIVSLEGAYKWIEKELKKLPKQPNNVVKKPHKSECVAKYKLFKAPFVKLEASNKFYRPLHHELESWPRINVDTPRGSCPFDGTLIKGGEQSQEERGLLAAQVDVPSEDTPKEEKDGLGFDSNTPRLTDGKSTKKSEMESAGGSKILTAGEIRRQKEIKRKLERKRGYCECCQVKYEDLDKHVRDEQHRAYIKDKSHYQKLDELIQTGPSAVQFISGCLSTAVSLRNRKPVSAEEEEEVLIDDSPLKDKTPTKRKQPPVSKVNQSQSTNGSGQKQKQTSTKCKEGSAESTESCEKTRKHILKEANCGPELATVQHVHKDNSTGGSKNLKHSDHSMPKRTSPRKCLKEKNRDKNEALGLETSARHPHASPRRKPVSVQEKENKLDITRDKIKNSRDTPVEDTRKKIPVSSPKPNRCLSVLFDQEKKAATEKQELETKIEKKVDDNAKLSKKSAEKLTVEHGETVETGTKSKETSNPDVDKRSSSKSRKKKENNVNGEGDCEALDAAVVEGEDINRAKRDKPGKKDSNQDQTDAVTEVKTVMNLCSKRVNSRHSSDDFEVCLLRSVQKGQADSQLNEDKNKDNDNENKKNDKDQDNANECKKRGRKKDNDNENKKKDKKEYKGDNASGEGDENLKEERNDIRRSYNSTRDHDKKAKKKKKEEKRKERNDCNERKVEEKKQEIENKNTAEPQSKCNNKFNKETTATGSRDNERSETGSMSAQVDFNSDFQFLGPDGEVHMFTKSLAERIKERSRSKPLSETSFNLESSFSAAGSNSVGSTQGCIGSSTKVSNKQDSKKHKGVVSTKRSSQASIASKKVLTKYRARRDCVRRFEASQSGYQGDDDETDLEDHKIAKNRDSRKGKDKPRTRDSQSTINELAEAESVERTKEEARSIDKQNTASVNEQANKPSKKRKKFWFYVTDSLDEGKESESHQSQEDVSNETSKNLRKARAVRAGDHDLRKKLSNFSYYEPEIASSEKETETEVEEMDKSSKVIKESISRNTQKGSGIEEFREQENKSEKELKPKLEKKSKKGIRFWYYVPDVADSDKQTDEEVEILPAKLRNLAGRRDSSVEIASDSDAKKMPRPKQISKTIRTIQTGSEDTKTARSNCQKKRSKNASGKADIESMADEEESDEETEQMKSMNLSLDVVKKKKDRKKFWDYVPMVESNPEALDPSLPKELQLLKAPWNNVVDQSEMRSRRRNSSLDRRCSNVILQDSDLVCEESKSRREKSRFRKFVSYVESDSEDVDLSHSKELQTLKASRNIIHSNTVKVRSRTTSLDRQPSTKTEEMKSLGAKKKKDRSKFWEYVTYTESESEENDPNLPKELQILKTSWNKVTEHCEERTTRRNDSLDRQPLNNEAIDSVDKSNTVKEIDKPKYSNVSESEDSSKAKKAKKNRPKFLEYVTYAEPTVDQVEPSLPKELQILKASWKSVTEQSDSGRSRRRNASLDSQSTINTVEVDSKISYSTKETISDQVKNHKAGKVEDAADDPSSNESEVDSENENKRKPNQKQKKDKAKFWEYVTYTDPESDEMDPSLPKELKILKASWNSVTEQSDSGRSKRRNASLDRHSSNKSVDIDSEINNATKKIISKDQVRKHKAGKTKDDVDDPSSNESEVDSEYEKPPKPNQKQKKDKAKFWEYVTYTDPESDEMDPSLPKELKILKASWNSVTELSDSGRSRRKNGSLERQSSNKTEVMDSEISNVNKENVSKDQVKKPKAGKTKDAVDDLSSGEGEVESDNEKPPKPKKKQKKGKAKFWEYVTYTESESDEMDPSLPKELQVLKASWNSVTEQSDSGRSKRRNASLDRQSAIKTVEIDSEISYAIKETISKDQVKDHKAKDAVDHSLSNESEVDSETENKGKLNQKQKKDKAKFWEYVTYTDPESDEMDPSLPKELKILKASWNSVTEQSDSGRSKRRNASLDRHSSNKTEEIDSEMCNISKKKYSVDKMKKHKAEKAKTVTSDISGHKKCAETVDISLENKHSKGNKLVDNEINSEKTESNETTPMKHVSKTTEQIYQEKFSTVNHAVVVDGSSSPKFHKKRKLGERSAESKHDQRSASPVFSCGSPPSKRRKECAETPDSVNTDASSDESTLCEDNVTNSIKELHSPSKVCKENTASLYNPSASDVSSATTPTKKIIVETPGSGYSSTSRKNRRKQWKRKRNNDTLNESSQGSSPDNEKKRRRLEKLKYDLSKDSRNKSSSTEVKGKNTGPSCDKENVSSPKKSVQSKLELNFEKHIKSCKASIEKSACNKSADKNVESLRLQWEPSADKPAGVVKLNQSWSLLSDRSASKLVSSEGDRESFEGFTEEEVDKRIPSDLSYVECSEVDVVQDSEHEWVIDKQKDNEGSERDEFVKYLPPTFSSPGKRSDSSWLDACEDYIDKSLQKDPKNSSLCFSYTSPWRSPMKKSKVSNKHAHNSECSTPKKSANKCDTVEKVDKDIEFNFSSPQKRHGGFSPLRYKNGCVIDTSTPHSERMFSVKPIQKSGTLNYTQGSYDGLRFTCESEEVDIGVGSKEFKLLKKVSNNKKKFSLNFDKSPIKLKKGKKSV